jgi:hypothetical protein
MAKLTSKGRKAIAQKNFALPGRRYPIKDKSHARNALARVAQHGSAAEKAEVRAKVKEKYPSISKKQTTAVGREVERRLSERDRR